jgi:hypothetical protein
MTRGKLAQLLCGKTRSSVTGWISLKVNAGKDRGTAGVFRNDPAEGRTQ